MRDFKIAAFLGFKSIVRGNRATVVLMIFILSLAFVNLVFISSILGGILVAINQQVKTNVVSNIVIDPQEEPVRKNFIERAGKLRANIESLPGVAATVRRYKLAATLAYDKNKDGKYKFSSGEVSGIEPEQEKHLATISEHMVSGQYLTGLGSGEILLGADLAGGYGGDEFTSLGGVKAGQKVKATFSNGIIRDYTVKGVFKVNFGIADRQAFITAKEAESILGVSDSASEILAKTEPAADEAQIQSQIQTLAPELKVRRWSDYLGALAGISKSFDMITLMISAIGLAVAAITIFILIYVNVVHKRRQIGILKAIGIRQSIIIYSYILQALFYAVTGIMLGAALVFFAIAPYFNAHPLQLPVGETALALNGCRITYSILGIFLAAVIAGLLPSWRGARENILKAIWGA